ncbi:MAG: hypothetical protein QOD38_2042 [Acidimicrobiaceae bacterium]
MTVATPEITVVIPCKNEEAFLAEQLAALATQVDPGSWEVVLVDNRSTDRSVEIARGFEERLPELRIVDASEQSGRQYACNVGARAARGAALVFLDGDDVVTPGYINAMAAALREHRFVAARLEYQSLNAPWLRRVRRDGQATGLQDWHHLPIAAGCSLGIDRALFLELGGFDDGMHYAEDVEFCWRAQLAGVELHFAGDAVLRYRYRDRVRALYRQARGYGRGAAVVYRLYDSPAVTPRSKMVGAVALVGRLARRVPKLRDRTTRAISAWDLGYFVGWVEGSIRPWHYCQPRPRSHATRS